MSPVIHIKVICKLRRRDGGSLLGGAALVEEIGIGKVGGADPCVGD